MTFSCATKVHKGAERPVAACRCGPAPSSCCRLNTRLVHVLLLATIHAELGFIGHECRTVFAIHFFGLCNGRRVGPDFEGARWHCREGKAHTESWRVVHAAEITVHRSADDDRELPATAKWLGQRAGALMYGDVAASPGLCSMLNGGLVVVLLWLLHQVVPLCSSARGRGL